MPILIEIGDKNTIKIQRELQELFGAMLDRVPAGQLQRLLENHDIDGVLSLLRGAEDDFGPFLDRVDDVIRASGNETVSMIPAAAMINPKFRFDMFSERTSEFIRGYRFNLIRDLTEETLDAVRQSILSSQQTGLNPIATARRFRSSLGLTSRQEQAIRNYQRALEDMDSTALNRALRDKRFDRTVLRSIKDRKPLTRSQINQMVERYRQKSLKSRAETIARTEALRATSVGNRAAISQMINAGAIDPFRVRRQWVRVYDSKTRDAHQTVVELNPDGITLDGVYQTELGPLAYPRDPAGSAANTINCRCSERYFVVEGAA